MRGKNGPVPEPLSTRDPTAEEIVGEKNVLDVGSPSVEYTEADPEETLRQFDAASPTVEDFAESELRPPGYKCADCTFTSNLLSEIEEHCNGMWHGGYGPKAPETPQQTSLFNEPGTIHRSIEIPLDTEFLNEKRTWLAALYQSTLEIKKEKKDADSDFNARLKNIDEQMQQIAGILKRPFTYENVDCEWRIIEEENARGLYRLDTGEMIEKQALTAEDRAAELQKAESENAEQVAEEREVAAMSDNQVGQTTK